MQAFPLDAEQFAEQYRSNPPKYNRTYKNQWLELEGQIDEFYKAQSGEMLIVIYSPNQTTGVKAELLHSVQQLKKPLKIGQSVKIIGLCQGFDQYVLLKKTKLIL